MSEWLDFLLRLITGKELVKHKTAYLILAFLGATCLFLEVYLIVVNMPRHIKIDILVDGRSRLGYILEMLGWEWRIVLVVVLYVPTAIIYLELRDWWRKRGNPPE